MKRIRHFIIPGIIIFTAFLPGCKNSLLPDSIGEEITITKQDASNTIDIPQELKATKGKKQKITLTWEAVSKAAKYNIYAAKTPFETFTKIGETSGTEYIYNLNSGLTRYFRVTAVNYLGEESSASTIVSGATLACPLISNITNELNETNSNATVYWYMENVSEYQDMVRYEIVAYENSKRIDEKFIDGSKTVQTYVTFENVPQHSTLEFQVTAYLSDEQSDTEISKIMDITTAAKQTPNAVSDLHASWATSLNSITLTFNLPEPSFIKTGTNAGNAIYEQYPLYFKVWRRESETENWTLVTDHLYYDGSIDGYEKTFESTDSDAVKAEKKDLWFNDYIPGTEVTFNDEGLSNKTEYEYKIQSYLDNYKTTVTSNISSVATVSGHTAAQPSITTKDFNYQYTFDDDGNPTSKENASFGFNFNWEDFGTADSYNLILETTKTGLAADASPEVSYKQIPDINSFSENFIFTNTESDDETEGYYEYSIYIVENTIEISATTPPESFLAKTSAPGKLLISPAMALPEIRGFSITDGFKDKISITWETDEFITYSLSRYEIDKYGNKISEVENDLLNMPGDTPAESGKCYMYTLTASNERYGVPSNPIRAETLGIPAPIFDSENAKHDTITISWPEVQKATKYSVTFENGDTKLGIFTYDISAENNEGITEKNGIFSCSLSEPTGYNVATLSGKNWSATVTATNSTENETSGSENVFTLGPAAVSNLTATVAESSSNIKVKWNTVPGAKGYAVRRARCDVKAPYNEESVDVYTVPATGGNVKANGTDVTAVTALYDAENGLITLTDTYKELPSENPSGWDSNQDKLAWGFPYKYTVFPLEADEELETDAGDTSAILGQITYSFINADEISDMGSCIGYGHKVTASKAEDPKTITVTWTQPFGIPDDLEPCLWYRTFGDTEWTLNNTKASKNNAGLYSSFILTPIGSNRTKAFEYAVTYSARNIKPNASYLENMISVMDEEYSPTESLNKGYAFAIDFTAEPILIDGNPSFSEEFSWKLWDYSKRAVGPAPEAIYNLCLKNNDFFIKSETDDGWRTIADINMDGVISTDLYSSNFGATKYNISVTPGTNKITVSPLTAKQYNTALTSDKAKEGVYDGLLKIQRDYKHYAKLSVTRTNSKDKIIEACCSDKEEYAYRNLTDGELARMALMTFAYAFYLNDGGNAALTSMGQFKYGGANTIYAAIETDNQKGSASFTDRESAATITSNWGKFRHYFTFLNYNSSLLTPGNETAVTPVSISCSKSSCMIKGDADNFVYCIETSPLKISTKACGDDYSLYPDLLKADLNISVPDNNSITVSIKRNNSTSGTEIVSTSDNGTRKWWFPMQIHSDKSYLFTSPDYGWWVKNEAAGGNE